MLRYHMGAPPKADTYDNSKTSSDMAKVLKEGTDEYKSLVSKLDYAAKELQVLEDAKVAVIWAPYHEVQPSGWFWWAKGTPEQFKQLWQFTYEYLTNSKGLDNLLWLMPYSHNPDGAWLPDKKYFDIGGPDTYETTPPFTPLFSKVKAIFGSTVPIPLHETGMIPQPDTMFPDKAPWLLFNVWAGYQKDSHNTPATVKSAYASDYTLTLDELPSFK
jgi:hypothetical protein